MLKNQIKQIAIGLCATRFAFDNPDSETKAQGAVAVLLITLVEVLS
jgi:hypothetical protein